MQKIWRPVGAVAIYSPVRALAVMALAMFVLIGAGFLAGRGTASDDLPSAKATAESTSDSTATTAPASPREDAEPAPAAEHTSQEKGRAFDSGYRRGVKDALGGSSQLTVGKAYIFKVEKGRRGASYRVGARVEVEPGSVYRLCRGGNSVCARP